MLESSQQDNSINNSMSNSYITVPNALSPEQCANIIANAEAGVNHLQFQFDILKADTQEQHREMSKEELDFRSVEKSVSETSPKRKIMQAHQPLEHQTFSEWAGLPVYRSKVMKYSTGGFCTEHCDGQWQTISNYWVPNTNLYARHLIIIPLNDDYVGGELSIEGEVVEQTVGTAIQMPQSGDLTEPRVKHGVNYVAEGVRYALVMANFG